MCGPHDFGRYLILKENTFDAPTLVHIRRTPLCQRTCFQNMTKMPELTPPIQAEYLLLLKSLTFHSDFPGLVLEFVSTWSVSMFLINSEFTSFSSFSMKPGRVVIAPPTITLPVTASRTSADFIRRITC